MEVRQMIGFVAWATGTANAFTLGEGIMILLLVAVIVMIRKRQY